MILRGVYDARLVALSCLVAVLASLTALDLAGRVTAARARARLAWLIGGAVAMGLGIWAMHFIGMLAFSLPTRLSYDVPLVLLSMITPMFASGLALFVASRRALGVGGFGLGGVCMGLAIAAMHYIGMAALRIDGAIAHYNPVIVAASVAVAILASLAALGITFRLRGAHTRVARWWRVAGACVLGGAIVGMHYTGMAALHVTATSAELLRPPQSSLGLATAIALVTLLILGIALYSSLIDQRFAAQAASNEHLRREIDERKQAEEALRESEGRFRALVQHAADVIEVVGADGVVDYVSPAFERVLGYTPAERVGQNVLTASLTHPDDLPALRAIFTDLAERPGGSMRLEVRLRHRDGTWRDMEATATNLLHEPGVGAFVGNYRDITEHKAFEAQLLRQAFHDPLTGLANRALFSNRLEHAQARARRSNRPLAVLYMDLDRFKVVNDSLTHAAGDQLLVEFGRRLQACLRPDDTAARLGGDEFAVLLESVTATADAERVAERILDMLRAPFAIGQHEIVITTSIGISVSAAEHRDAGELLRAADLAMYRAKQTGKAHYEVFDAGMASRALTLLELEADLRRALERGELRIHYQPKVELDTGRLVGLEALLRWEHPQHGLVSPDAFISLAEETGLILPIDRWVLKEACHQTRIWQASSPAVAALQVCVNVSARHFQHPELVAEVAAALDATGLHPGSLVLEITERAVMADAAANIATLHALKALGVHLAIDDFGTGYSSLSYLQRFPIDILKIDRSFIDGLGREAEDTVIVRAVIGLAQALGLVVVAEGVETAEQVTQLQALGCRLCQGYYFSRPLPGAEVDALLARDIHFARSVARFGHLC